MAAEWVGGGRQLEGEGGRRAVAYDEPTGRSEIARQRAQQVSQRVSELLRIAAHGERWYGRVVQAYAAPRQDLRAFVEHRIDHGVERHRLWYRSFEAGELQQVLQGLVDLRHRLAGQPRHLLLVATVRQRAPQVMGEGLDGHEGVF